MPLNLTQNGEESAPCLIKRGSGNWFFPCNKRHRPTFSASKSRGLRIEEFLRKLQYYFKMSTVHTIYLRSFSFSSEDNSTALRIPTLTIFCYVFLRELRGHARVVGSYSITPPARGPTQKHLTKYHKGGDAQHCTSYQQQQ